MSESGKFFGNKGVNGGAVATDTASQLIVDGATEFEGNTPPPRAATLLEIKLVDVVFSVVNLGGEREYIPPPSSVAELPTILTLPSVSNNVQKRGLQPERHS